MKAYVVLVTTPNRKASEKISKCLLSHKLAACVNRVSGLTSRYWWKGKIETAREELLIIKTRKDKLVKLTAWVRKNHPYAMCEVLALPVAAGNPTYLQWITDSLR